MAHNLQIEIKKIKLLTKYKNVTQKSFILQGSNVSVTFLYSVGSFIFFFTVWKL
jgi:hypothetical protein